jgi:hypothetical protein
MLNDTDAAFVALDTHCARKRREIAAPPKNGSNENHNTHKKIL